MQGHELRKLITTFLVLALLAGSASLALTSYERQKSDGVAVTTKETPGNQVPKIGDKAIVENVTTNPIAGYDLAKEFTPSTGSDDNYTDNLAKGLAYQFVKANPEGPDLTSGVGITPPSDLEGIMGQYITDAALTPTTYAIDTSRIKIAKSYTPEQLGEYLSTTDKVLKDIAGERGIANLVKKTSGTELTEASVQSANFIYANAQEELYAVVVPEPAAKLNQALLTYLELNRKINDLDYTTDPLKAVVFVKKFPEFQAREETNLKLAMAEFQQDAPSILSDATLDSIPRIAWLTGTKTAHAQWAVFDAAVFGAVTSDVAANVEAASAVTGTWVQQLIEYAIKIGTQILKNQLVGRLIQQTIKWVQGGGKPQFITNWKSFLKDAGTSAVDRVLTDIAPRLCTNFRSFVTNYNRENTQNGISGSRDQFKPITCTLDQVVQNVKNFYDDFRSGGWLGLSALLLPQNNVWGAIILSHESAIGQAAESVSAASQDASANKGFKGFTKCTKYTEQTIPEAEMVHYTKRKDFVGMGNKGCYKQSTPLTNCQYDERDDRCQPTNERYCDVRLCSPDGQQLTTPGGFVGEQLNKAVGGTLENIVNADDLSGLVAALVDAAISKLTSFATNGLLGLFSGSDSGSGTGTGGTGTSTQPGGTTTPGDIAGLQAQAAQLINSNVRRATDAITSNSTWSTLASSTQPLLGSVALTCPTQATDAAQRQESIGRIAPLVEADKSALGSIQNQLASTSQAISEATDAITIANLLTSLDTTNSALATLGTRVSTRVTQLSALSGSAQANLTGRACNTPLTPLDE